MICSLLSPLGIILAICAGGFLAAYSIPGWVAFGSCLSIGFAGLLLSHCRAYTKWRCPTCNEPLLRYGTRCSFGGDLLKMPTVFRFCPYCGQSLDEELEIDDQTDRQVRVEIETAIG